MPGLNLARAGRACLLAALPCLAVAAAQGRRPTQVTRAALPPAVTTGRGARVPFDEYEAENGATSGTVIGPDRRFGTIAAEASGRRAVRLSRSGDYVAFTLARAANALTVRAALPDTEDGGGRDGMLGVYADGRRIASLGLTSRYAWLYGPYPFTNRPADGGAHHVFDHARLLLGRMLSRRTTLRLVLEDAPAVPWVVVDVADLERVGAPRRPPPGAVSITDFGADPSGRNPSASAVAAAIARARARRHIVWIPPGTFRVDAQIDVDQVDIRGAGPWYSVVRGDPVGFYGRSAKRVRLRDFAILGEVAERIDTLPRSGVGGAMGGGSVLRNLWIQHEKVGAWFDGPMDGIKVTGLRILDTAADGLNFHRGVSRALVRDTFVRGSGDDGLAAWSGGAADHHIRFVRNTIVAPGLANAIAIYGGHDMDVSRNLVADSLTEGGGLHLGNRFDAVPLSGALRLTGNAVIRSGSFDPHWQEGVGAIWLYALDAPIRADIRIADTAIIGSTEEALQFRGKPITTVTIANVRIEGGRRALDVQADACLRLRGVRYAPEGRALAPAERLNDACSRD